MTIATKNECTERERKRERIVAEHFAFFVKKNYHYVYIILPFELISIPTKVFKKFP